ncbi:hypothetical protein TRIP_B350137 [uncultured Desulfatiglans sp.]|nr:hypothetical protein TRIP_B350137 [uncultured Desulfatiglans sp.]
MIVFVEVCVKSLFRLGRKYLWPRPPSCPKCEGKLWGHGYTTACFDGYGEPAEIPRYRCPACGCVVRLRPEGYFSRFQSSIETIQSSIANRLSGRGWLPGLSPSRQRHWLNSLIEQTKLHLGLSWSGQLPDAFELLHAVGICPVSRSIQCERRASFVGPHRRLPFTSPREVGYPDAKPQRRSHRWTNSSKKTSPFSGSG